MEKEPKENTNLSDWWNLYFYRVSKLFTAVSISLSTTKSIAGTKPSCKALG